MGQDEMIKQGRLDKPYNGVLDCTKRVLATEGVYPFCRGNMANVLRYFPTQALNFAFKDTIKAAFKTSKDAPQSLKSAGIQGLYRGFTISAVGIFIYRGMYFGLYDTLKPLLLGKDAGVFLSFFLGWAVTVTAGLMS